VGTDPVRERRATGAPFNCCGTQYHHGRAANLLALRCPADLDTAERAIGIPIFEPGRQSDRVPEKSRRPRIPRLSVDLERRALLLHPAISHHHHLVGERECLLLVVGNQERGDLFHCQRCRDKITSAAAQPRIQGRERLVQQHDPRATRQGSGQGRALLLTTGKLMREHFELHPGQADQFEELPQPAPVAAFSPVERELDVAADVEMRKQRPLLRNVSDVSPFGRRPGPGPGHRLPPSGNRSTVGLFETGDHAQQGRFSTARRTEQSSRTPCGQRQVHSVQRAGSPERLHDTAHRKSIHLPTARRDC